MSDIETPPNSVLEVKLDYIQRDIKVIKDDVKEMKADYVTRREFDNNLKEVSDTSKARFLINEKNIDMLLSYVKWIVGIVGVAIIGAILKLVIK